jgi:hypothetical protein
VAFGQTALGFVVYFLDLRLNTHYFVLLSGTKGFNNSTMPKVKPFPCVPGLSDMRKAKGPR